MAKKPSFFDRLTGASFDIDFDAFQEEAPQQARRLTPTGSVAAMPSIREDVGEAQLTVDVYQSPDEIVIKALVAGVKPEEIDISITRDMVTIAGKRIEQKEIEENDYVYRELFWGAFSRTVVLPAEIDVDMAEADQKHGLLTIRLPKINKDRQTKLKVRGN
ncbi:MAG: Hsp20/alpha crystallin family protein [Patescibacteria group bacterium]